MRRPSKITRQGVRDLGNDTRRYRPSICTAHLPGHDYIVVGWEHNSVYESEPIYGKRCIKCGEAC